MKYFILAALLGSSQVFGQAPAPIQTQGQAELCSMAAQTVVAPRVAEGVTLPFRTKIPSTSGFNLADGSVKDYMNADIYTYDAGNASLTPPRFYARYREPLKNLDNEPNAPRVGMMEIDKNLDPEIFQGGAITCPINAIYQPHWFYDIRPNELICVKREKDGQTTYAVIQVNAVCASPNWGIVFNWVATRPVNAAEPNVFKADQVQVQKP